MRSGKANGLGRRLSRISRFDQCFELPEQLFACLGANHAHIGDLAAQPVSHVRQASAVLRLQTREASAMQDRPQSPDHVAASLAVAVDSAAKQTPSPQGASW